MDKIRCSVGILTLNSGRTLRRTLESVKDFDDILLCDGGSTDETLAIAEEFGARVIEQDPQFRGEGGRLIDYGGVRNQCLDAARYDWFLYIDSDESISEGLHDDIARIVQEDSAPLVYRVPIGIILDGTHIRYSSNYPGYQFRFFNRKSGARFIKPVHERIDFDPKSPFAGTLAHPWFIYTTQDDWRHYLEEGRRYRDIAVAKFQKEPWGRIVLIVIRNLKSALGVLLRTIRIYLWHGTRGAIPMEGEMGRLLDPLILSARVVWAKLTGKEAKHPPSRFAYLAYIRMPTERAHGLQIMETCAALVAEGKEVELIVPTRDNPLAHLDPFTYYSLTTRFPITFLLAPDMLSWGPLGYLAGIASFARAARRYLRSHPARVVFSRDERALAGLSTRSMIVWESHTGAWNDAARKMARKAKCIVVITQGLKDFYVSKGVPEKKIVVAPDGVDTEAFAKSYSRIESRTRLGLPLDAPIAMYVGKLDGWKGVETFLEASAFVEAACVVIGGEESELPSLKEQYPHVRFLGPRPYSELPGNLAAADVLVIPNTGKDEISARFTSPLKLFAYMASGKPIIASDLPSLREVIDEDTAFMFEPDNPVSLAEGLRQALKDPAEAGKRASRARGKVNQYTWGARVRTILNHLRV